MGRRLGHGVMDFVLLFSLSLHDTLDTRNEASRKVCVRDVPKLEV